MKEYGEYCGDFQDEFYEKQGSGKEDAVSHGGVGGRKSGIGGQGTEAVIIDCADLSCAQLTFQAAALASGEGSLAYASGWC